MATTTTMNRNEINEKIYKTEIKNALKIIFMKGNNILIRLIPNVVCIPTEQS